MKLYNDGTLKSEFENLYLEKQLLSTQIANTDAAIADLFRNNSISDVFPRFIDSKKELLNDIYNILSFTELHVVYQTSIFEEAVLLLGRILLEKHKNPGDQRHTHIFIEFDISDRIPTAEYFYTANDYDSIKVIVDNVFSVTGVYEKLPWGEPYNKVNLVHDNLYYTEFLHGGIHFLDALKSFFYQNDNWDNN